MESLYPSPRQKTVGSGCTLSYQPNQTTMSLLIYVFSGEMTNLISKHNYSYITQLHTKIFTMSLFITLVAKLFSLLILDYHMLIKLVGICWDGGHHRLYFTNAEVFRVYIVILRYKIFFILMM